MSCDELRDLLHGYVDGELDLVHNVECEHHLGACSACAAALAEQQTLRKALREPTLYHPMPVGLSERVRSSLRRRSEPRVRFPVRYWRRLAVAAALVLLTFGAWGLVAVLSLPSARDRLAQEVVSSHVRSLMAGHLLDVTSSDQHTVKPWFTREGQLGFAPIVKDLAAKDYVLVGGRLDYIGNQKVAALVYRRHQHIINLFIWPANGAPDERPHALTRQGYQLFHWTQSGLTCWVVSDLNEQDLRSFVELVRK